MAADAPVGLRPGAVRVEALRGRAAFDRVYREGRRVGGPVAVLVVRAGGGSGVRAGIAVGRAAGRAVARNRLRRRLREAFRSLAGRMRPGFDVVIVARPEAARRPFAALVDDLETLLRRAEVLGPGGEAAAGEGS